MIMQCVLWTLALYGFFNICINAVLRYMYNDVDVTIKIKNANGFEYIIRTLEYKLWYLRNVTYVNKVNDNKLDSISKKLEQDYGIKIIKDE